MVKDAWKSKQLGSSKHALWPVLCVLVNADCVCVCVRACVCRFDTG